MDDFKTLLSVKKSMTTDIVMKDFSVTVFEAAKAMTESNVNSILLTESENIKGILTETDIVRKVVALGADYKDMSATEVMSGPIIHIESDLSIFEAKKIMKEKDVKHLIIKEDDKVVGMISANDLTKS